MTGLILKYWKPLALITLAAFFVWGFSHWRYSAGRDDADAAWQHKWDQRDIADAAALAKRQSDERAEERHRQGAIDAISSEAQRGIERAQADAVIAQSAADGLSATISNLKRQLAASETGRVSATAAAGAARTNAGILLADVLQRADKRAGELAAYADRARLAGLTCERAYSAITGK
ncbi:DUF2514 family protein [Dickeya solani]|uniref:DUF2514 family protein n=1 Tax=Dickeya solani TaxID=1089444 RepID=A0ABU4EH64_9GAMM|nr:DUF2514 family protein [Dickeya solani]MCZ0823698.1 DUF2514 family protein [Dickeya solani]MDV6995605.1 DUF2514 family protein [Dickeya solani]MDV7002884.1 DUF2514 family protein [Dickeya solani]MDV7036660.1 DUF2514 family protein [Dickeya solani]MDV7043413.1 DUF2514 family protein [Dickeya solani]